MARGFWGGALMGALGLAISGCGDDGGGGSAVDAGSGAIDAGCAPALTIFLNRAGGSWTPGPEDPGGNVSGILSEAVTLDPYPAADSVWNAAVDCVRDDFAAYRVDIVDSDPGAGLDHMEVAVVDGTASAIGLSGGTTSISPFSCDLLHGTAFVFGSTFAEAQLCREMEFTIAKLIGLDNVVGCGDISSYGACTEATVTDEDQACGEFDPRECNCDRGTTQNSHALVSERIGVCP